MCSGVAEGRMEIGGLSEEGFLASLASRLGASCQQTAHEVNLRKYVCSCSQIKLGRGRTFQKREAGLA